MLLYDMFLILKTVYFTGCVDTPFAVADDIEDRIQYFEKVGENLLIWFSNNQMKLNSDKCHLILNTKEQTTLKRGNLYIKNAFSKKLLRMNFG